METEVRSIRTAVQHQQELRAGTAVRYPEALRRKALAYASRRRRSGDSLKSIAGVLGLRPQLLCYWRKKATGRVLRRVRITATETSSAPPPRACPVLITPRGLRVEGLDVDSLAALLSALA